MKNSTGYFFSVLFSLIIFGNNAFAQESTSSMHFSLFGGIALPQGDFGSTVIDYDKAGFAKTGFSAMVEGSKNLNENVLWVSSLSLALNSMDESAMKNRDSFYEEYNATAGSYLTTWAMTGIVYETAISPSINIYGVGQIGLLLSSVPEVKISGSNYYGPFTENITSKIGTSFAFSLGGGVKINKINIALRYFSGEPEYEQTYKGDVLTVIDGYYTITDSKTEKTKKPASVLQLLVGITL
ncbi:MAG: hypothetical protein Q8S01_05685 [Ignavibacteria bacterium]|nr:hypothetical protein [Ignavibacteria bacterium]